MSEFIINPFQFGSQALLNSIIAAGVPTTNLKLCMDVADSASYPGGSMTTSAGPSTLTTKTGSWGNETLRQVIDAAQISTSGSKVVVTFGGEGSGIFTITKAYIGHQGAGDAYDFDTTPVQLTFGGNPGFTIDGALTISSDPATFALDETKNLVISFYVPLSAEDAFGTQATLTGWSSYWKVGDDASTVNATGYTNYTGTRNVVGVKQIDAVTAGDGGQLWTDRSSSATNFVRGEIAVPDSADPTFNGTAGALDAATYWSFDGGDYFTLASGANPSWVEPFHKDGATFTIMCGYYHDAIETHFFVGDVAGLLSGTGFMFQANSNAGTPVLRLRVQNAGSFALSVAASDAPVSNAWNIVGVSVSENAGASGGAFSVNGSTNTFDPAYSSPSSGSASVTLKVASDGASTETMPSISRMSWIAVWDSALSAAQMQSIFSQTRDRFSI